MNLYFLVTLVWFHFFLHLSVMPVVLIVQYVCLGAGLTPSEPPELAPPLVPASLWPDGWSGRALPIMRVGTGDLGAGGCWDPGGFLSVTPYSPS